jgi:hypothetical protein
MTEAVANNAPGDNGEPRDYSPMAVEKRREAIARMTTDGGPDAHPIPRETRQQRAMMTTFRMRNTGDLIPPSRCPLCGEPPAPGDVVVAHHPRYEPDRYRDVVPCCRRCHAAIHAVIRNHERNQSNAE